MGPRVLRRLASLLAVPVLVVGLLLAAPQPGWSASGGRIGGGSFRSAPLPRSSGGGGYRGGYRGSYPGGYPGGPYGGYYGGGSLGGGMGFPFIIPIYGFGGGGLLGFLVLMAVVGLLLNALRSSGSQEGTGTLTEGSVSIAQVQVGLLASARDLQADLRRMAATADTGSSAGLQKVLQETTLALLRHPELWVYANGEVGQVPFNAAESTFNRLTMGERSKLQRELTTNVAGRRSSEPVGAIPAGPSDSTSDYIAVTLLLATRRRLSLRGTDTAENLRETLQQLGAVGADDLLALEVIWQPEGAGEVLTGEELLTAYPELQHL